MEEKKAAPAVGIQLKEKKRDTKWWIAAVITFLFMFGWGHVVKPWGSVTEVGVQLIGVFFGLLTAVIVTNDLLWPSFLAMLALIYWGYYAKGSAAVSGMFGNSTVFQFIMMQALIRPAVTSGAGNTLAKMILTRKFIQKKPLLLTFMFFFAFAVASNFMNIFGTVMLAFPIIKSCLDAAGYTVKDRYAQCMYLGTFIAANVGPTIKSGISAATIVKFGYFNTALEGTGITINTGTYTIAIAVALFIFIIVYTLAMKFLFRCDFSKLSDTSFRDMPEMMSGTRFTKPQAIYLGAFIVFVLYGVVFQKLFSKGTSRFALFMNNMGLYCWALVILIILTFLMDKDPVTGEKKPMMNPGKMLKESTSWDMAFVLGAFTVVGMGIASGDAGVASWLQSICAPVLSNTPSWLFLFLIVALTTIITNFFSNTATGQIFATIGAALCVPFVINNGMNPTLVMAGVSLGAPCAYLTFSASGAAPLYLNEEAADNKFVWTYGVYTLILYIIVVWLVLTVMDVIL